MTARRRTRIKAAGAGALAGIAVSFRGLHRLLTNHRRQVIYLVIGLMLGSLYAVVMGPTTLAEAQPAVSAATFDLIFFIIGLGIIFVFEAVKRKAEHKKLPPWLPMMLWRATTRTTSEVGN